MRQKDDKLPVVSILGTDNDENLALCRLVHNHTRCYRTAVYTRLSDLSAGLAAGGCMAVILDLDSVPLDNRTICRLTTSFPEARFFCASSARLHPDLKDAISRHLFACLTKPIDRDELHFFLKSVRDDYLEDGTHGPA